MGTSRAEAPQETEGRILVSRTASIRFVLLALENKGKVPCPTGPPKGVVRTNEVFMRVRNIEHWFGDLLERHLASGDYLCVHIHIRIDTHHKSLELFSSVHLAPKSNAT